MYPSRRLPFTKAISINNWPDSREAPKTTQLLGQMESPVLRVNVTD